MSAVLQESNRAIARRSNKPLATIHRNAAVLLKRIHDAGEVTPRDRAMAGIMSEALDKRKEH